MLLINKYLKKKQNLNKGHWTISIVNRPPKVIELITSEHVGNVTFLKKARPLSKSIRPNTEYILDDDKGFRKIIKAISVRKPLSPLKHIQQLHQLYATEKNNFS